MFSTAIAGRQGKADVKNSEEYLIRKRVNFCEESDYSLFMRLTQPMMSSQSLMVIPARDTRRCEKKRKTKMRIEDMPHAVVQAMIFGIRLSLGRAAM